MADDAQLYQNRYSSALTDNIVTRLHQWRLYNDGEMLTSPSDSSLSLTLIEAADHIERLNYEIEQLRWTNRRLYDLYEGLYNATEADRG